MTCHRLAEGSCPTSTVYTLSGSRHKDLFPQLSDYPKVPATCSNGQPPWLCHAAASSSYRSYGRMLGESKGPLIRSQAAKPRETILASPKHGEATKPDNHPGLLTDYITFFDDSSRVWTGSESWKSWVSSTTCTSLPRITALCRAPRSARRGCQGCHAG